MTGIREGQNIDYSKLKGVRIPVPPVEEQLKIAAYLDSIEARIEEISLLKKYKDAISSDIVTGKIDVRDIKIPDYEIVEEDIDEENNKNAEIVKGETDEE